jgi:hypothetical protein
MRVAKRDGTTLERSIAQRKPLNSGIWQWYVAVAPGGKRKGSMIRSELVLFPARMGSR